MHISFEDNLRDFERSLDDVQKNQLPFATALALTETARDEVKLAIELRIVLAFDRPTPFTRRGVAYRPAKKHALVATVLIKDVQARYLLLEKTGGTRLPKKRALAIPARQRVNRYGNLPRGSVQRLLAREDTFSGTVNGQGGIWQRTKNGVKLVVAWESQAQYKPTFRFYQTARETAEVTFPHRFAQAFDRAMATAR